MSGPPTDESSTQPQEGSANKRRLRVFSEILISLCSWIDNYRQKPRPKNKGIEIVGVWLTLAIAFAAFWSAYVFQGQLSEARRATQTTLDSFRTDGRAWVGIEKIEIMRTYPANGQFGAAFRFGIYPKNFGKTQAREVAFTDVSGIWTSITQGDNPSWVNSVQDKMLTGKFKGADDIPMNKAVPKVIGPGIASPVPFTVNAKEPTIFTNDEWVSYLIGRIDYVDAFHVRHWVKYCYFVMDARGTLWPCKYGNDEDDNTETPPN